MITTGQLAALIQARLIGDEAITLKGVEATDRAGPDQLTFVRSTAYAAAWRDGRAAAVLAGEDIPLDRVMNEQGQPGPGRAVLIVPDVDASMITVLERFMPPSPPYFNGIHPSAQIDPLAKIAPGVSIGPGCSVGAGAVIGSGCKLIAGVHVCAYVQVGERTVLHPNVVLYERSVVGNDCILHAGVIIGADGFGYHPRPDGRGVIKIPHIGNVVIHDNVEIGANSCVDKGKFGSTVIGAGTKIDNLVQIGHNCQLGRSCILCGECGLSGSVKLGDGVVLGGRVGVADNVSIGSGARVGAYSGVSNDIPPGSVYLGMPAGPANEWKRVYGFLRRLGKNRGKPVW